MVSTAVGTAPGKAAAPARQRASAGASAQHLPLIAVLALAAVVRLWGLGAQPILYFDSGVYLGEGAFLASAAERAATALVGPGPSNPLERIALATETGTDAHPPDIAKPGHAILLAIAFLLLGKSALAGALVSALAGIGTVGVTYSIAFRAWGQRVAVAAAVLLAISGQHLVYSREPLVEADGLFFATLASLVYLRSASAKGLFTAGLLWGIAYSCNNRLSYLPVVFVVAELACWPGWGGLVRRGAIVAAGLLVPLVAIEGAYLLARAIGRAAGSPTDWLDYAQQLVTFTRMNPPDRVRFDEWPTYFVDLALMDGLAVLSLVLIGIGLVLWRLRDTPRSRAELLLAGSVLAPLALYSVYSTGEVRLRHFSLALPWVMLIAAIALEKLSALASRYQRWVFGGALAAVVLAAMPRIVALDTAPSGTPVVLNAIGTGRFASTNGPVMSFYVGEGRTNARLREAFVNVPEDLENLAQQYSTIVVDMQAEVFAGDLTDAYARATPRLVVANGSDAWYLADLLEHFGTTWGGWSDLLSKWQANQQAASELRVYNLRDLVPSGVKGAEPL